MHRRIALFVVIGTFIFSAKAMACGSCTIPRLGKDKGLRSESADKKFYIEYLYEQKNYDVLDLAVAHELHHDGHHIHNKTAEDLHHFKLGGWIGEKLHLFAEMPYVVRKSLDIHSHARLGARQTSEGWGDLNLIGDYALWQAGQQKFSAVTGIKLPTGETREMNSTGSRFEQELQPGSGSVDYVLGGIYGLRNERHVLVANMSYLVRTQGAQNFEYGDVFVSTLYYDYALNPRSAHFVTRIGADLVYQNEQKQRDAGRKVADSGGQTLLLGPVVNVYTNDQISITATLLYPVMQNLGGVHQELDYELIIGGKVDF